MSDLVVGLTDGVIDAKTDGLLDPVEVGFPVSKEGELDGFRNDGEQVRVTDGIVVEGIVDGLVKGWTDGLRGVEVRVGCMSCAGELLGVAVGSEVGKQLPEFAGTCRSRLGIIPKDWLKTPRSCP